MSPSSSEERMVKRTVKREMNPFQFHWHTFNFLFSESNKRKNCDEPLAKEGWYEMKGAGIVFVAFWVEAYLNYTLENVFPSKQYRAFERRSVEEKLDILGEKYSTKFDYSCLKGVVEFRNSLAHGKNHNPDEVFDVVPLSQYLKSSGSKFNDLESTLDTAWEKYLDKVDTDTLLKEVCVVLESIKNLSNLNFHPMGVGDMVISGGEVLA